MADMTARPDSSDPSMGGVWCSTHFQYRWRCQQDGVAHLCQQEAATKGKGKGKGEREEVLGDEDLEVRAIGP